MSGTEAVSAGRMCVSFLNDSDEKTLGGVLCMHVDGVVLGANGATCHSSVVVFVLLGRLVEPDFSGRDLNPFRRPLLQFQTGANRRFFFFFFFCVRAMFFFLAYFFVFSVPVPFLSSIQPNMVLTWKKVVTEIWRESLPTPKMSPSSQPHGQ